MPTVDDLREIAEALRKTAQLYEKQANETVYSGELDPEKVRDFLLFFGVRQ